MGATSGQIYGIGTLFLQPLSTPDDETVKISYKRWNVGTRLEGRSMPRFPGHALQAYHQTVLSRMRETGATAGFLVKKAIISPDALRPPASEANKGFL